MIESLLSRRARFFKKKNLISKGPVIYWMSRDQRAEDHWALTQAQKIAIFLKQPLVTLFCLTDSFLNASDVHFAFMLMGLKDTSELLIHRKIPFVLLKGKPEEVMPFYLKQQKASVLITDFNPLKITQAWKNNVALKTDIPVIEVDAHNIVPCWLASNKREFGAYTFRPKLNRLIEEYCTEIPSLVAHPFFETKLIQQLDWDKILSPYQRILNHIQLNLFKPGSKQAWIRLKKFMNTKLKNYAVDNSNPAVDGQSGLSPYLHFGQISAQAVVYEVLKQAPAYSDRFIEQIFIRRELSDNFCYYNPDYDKVKGFPEWSKKTLHDHKSDQRNRLYTKAELEQGQTYDKLWNAAQREMVITGKMHGYMRMYWAKKILEWTAHVDDALAVSIELNDKYSLDGRDPNGYTGIAWSIGGVHDRPWPERSIFGKIRYMNEQGCRKKFDVNAYIEKIEGIRI